MDDSTAYLKRTAEQYARQTASHELTVLHDDGLYRHLRYTDPDIGLYRYEVVTWPNALAVKGGGADYLFSNYPAPDLFELFRRSRHHGSINPGYWKQKVLAGQTRAWSQEKFRTWLTAKAAADEARHPGLTAAVTERILEGDEYDLDYEEGARTAVAWFDHDDYTLRMPDPWDEDFKDWAWQFLHACHTATSVIAAYDRHQAAAASTVLGEQEA